ncbi:hypothetical protein [Halobacillus massiliensis]|uniref:hypothetical protein n=1 Tax=Halobacillus massiliensis TaxID=1926286 RepID=UPI0009E30B12|nr:hypothetical protein [Halobacillus massiliensis]
MKHKRITALSMSFLLLLSTIPVSAEENPSSEKEKTEGEGSYAEKHEVVYANLDAAGDQKEMYVVNNFSIQDPGKIVDHGPYSSIQNLTDTTAIEQTDDRVEMTATDEEFYYQGNLEDKPLPWNVDISYKLDGKEMDPEDLLGKEGALEIQIETSKNDEADEVFFENYPLQISFTLNSKLYENIDAPDGTLANAGKNRHVTFMAMPEKEGSFTLTADVKDLEMESIEIAAVPSSLSIDAPDTGAMTDDFNSLANATSEINTGVGQLRNGIAELNDGAESLYNGSAQYNNGIQELDNGSAELVEGSAAIQSSLQQMNEAVGAGTSGDINLGDLTEMEDDLRELAGGLQEAEDRLRSLQEQYGQARQDLSQSVESIPGYEIGEEDIQALYDSGADEEVVDQLVETYEASKEVKQSYGSAAEAFDAVHPALETSIGTLSEINTNLDTVTEEVSGALKSIDIDESIRQLQDGVETLSSNYNSFHAGLTEYTGGVSQLAGSYQEIHNGIGELSNGTSELENGATELQEGTSQLADSTNDIPGQMESEIDSMMDEYDTSDFEPVSFVSSENEKVESVQFVIKTESIKKPADEEETNQEEEEKSFWTRFLDLFR